MSDGAAQRLLDLPDDLLAAILAAVCADDHFAASLATKRLRAARGHGAFRTRARATARSAALLAWGAAVGCPSPFPCWVIWRDRRCGKLLGHGQLQRDGQLLTLLTVEFGAGVPPREHGGFEDVRVLLDEVSSVEWIVDGEHLPGDEVCRSLFDFPRDEGVEGFDADRSQQGGVEIAADQLASVARLFQEVNTYPNKDGMQNEVPPRPTPHSQLSGRPPLPCYTHFTSLHPVQALPPLSPPYPYLL